MSEKLIVRDISNDEHNRLLRSVPRLSGSVETWRRPQMVLLSAQRKDVAQIATVAFTSTDCVRAVLHKFNDDGVRLVYPGYAGGRPPTLKLPQPWSLRDLNKDKMYRHISRRRTAPRSLGSAVTCGSRS